MAQHRCISQNENFGLVAKSIIDNIELWKVSKEVKTKESIDKRIESIEKRNDYSAKCRAESLLHKTTTDQSQLRGYNLGHGRSTGD